MGFWDTFRGWVGGGAAVTAPQLSAVAADETVTPDLSEFQRSQFGALTSPQILTLIAICEGMISSETRPELVPLEVIECMGWDPVIYLGESIVSAPVVDENLYYVKHDDPVIRAEIEEWLHRLLPDLLPIVTRSFFYGAIPYVFDWTVDDLQIRITKEGSTRNRRLPDYAHFSKVHELWPGDVQLEVENDDLLLLRFQGAEYKRDRAFVSVWDRKWGGWFGQGSRRRNYKPWFKGAAIDLWQSRWLERSVDPPRVGYAPKGTIKIDGKDIPTHQLMTAAVMSLKNGGATTLPGDFDKNSNERLWALDVLQLPDRTDVWEKSLNREDANKLIGTLVPPTAAGVEEGTFSGARVPAQFFVETIQRLAKYAAREVTCAVLAVHRVRHGKRKRDPRVLAYDLPAAKRKLLLDVFKQVVDVQRQLEDGRTVTMGEQVADDVIDQLGLTKIPAGQAAKKTREAPPAGPNGRPRDATGDRETRRDVAREPEGEDATGSESDTIDGA